MLRVSELTGTESTPAAYCQVKVETNQEPRERPFLSKAHSARAETAVRVGNRSPMARRVAVDNRDGHTPSTLKAAAASRASSMGTLTRTGIVHPPPDVRCIVDKTAEFVAENGVEFELKILSNEKKNPRFNFLKSKDTYHSYYQHRILEFIDQRQSPLKLVKQGSSESK